jgi:hypothetical protein
MPVLNPSQISGKHSSIDGCGSEVSHEFYDLVRSEDFVFVHNKVPDVRLQYPSFPVTTPNAPPPFPNILLRSCTIASGRSYAAK